MKKQMQTLLLQKLSARRKTDERLAPHSPGPASEAGSGFGMSRQFKLIVSYNKLENESHFDSDTISKIY